MSKETDTKIRWKLCLMTYLEGECIKKWRCLENGNFYEMCAFLCQLWFLAIFYLDKWIFIVKLRGFFQEWNEQKHGLIKQDFFAA